MRSVRFTRRVRLPLIGVVALLAHLAPAWGGGEGAGAGEDEQLARTLERAAAVDALVESELAARGIDLAPHASDPVFLRRAHISIVGRVPSLPEQEAFAADSAPRRRSRWIASLLASPGHVSARTHYWADLLRARTKLAKTTSGEPFLHWIKEALTQNRPYDEMVHELLTAEGPAHRRGNGATGLLARDRGMPEDSMSNTVRVFLGTRLECAQCHDHPFDRWSRSEYYRMVGFTGGIEYRSHLERTPEGQQLRRWSEKWIDKEGPAAKKALSKLLQPLDAGISGGGSGAVRLPRDYQYSDAEPDAWVVARTLFGDPVSIQPKLPDESALEAKFRSSAARQSDPDASEAKFRKKLAKLQAEDIRSRDGFAAWLTSPTNPRFTTVIVNRLWKEVMGRGLVEPADDFKDDTTACHPALLEHLEALMRELDYDLRAFQAVLYNTRTWQREASFLEPQPGEPHDLRGPVLRRMSAEELWDSILTLVVEDVDATLEPALGPGAEAVYEKFESLIGASRAEFRKRVKLAILRYTDKSAYNERMSEARAQAKALAGGLEAEVKPLVKALMKARRKGNDTEAALLATQLDDLGVDVDALRREKALKGLQRASDLPSPAPPGHFLREFGQSDRDTIEAASTGANVPQALSLLNGFLEERVLTNAAAYLSDVLAEVEDTSERVRICFRATLSRDPSPAELDLWQGDMTADPEAVTQDLVWTLLNTHEFLFVQ